MKLLQLLVLLLLSSSTISLPTESTGRESFTAPPSEVFTTPPSPHATVSRFAMLDDVRLLANGLLQLGQSLREFVHKTKGQMNDIFQRLNIFDHSVDQLSVVTSEIKEKEEELKKTTNFLKANNEEIKNLSLEINYKINGIMQERTQLQSKVGSLEEKLKGLSQGMVPVDQISEISTLKVSCAKIKMSKRAPTCSQCKENLSPFSLEQRMTFIFPGLELRRIRVSLLPNSSLICQRHNA